jgi:hypothetical protein
MTPKEVRNAIVTRYLTEFSGQFEIALDNQDFTPPETGEDVKWARVSVQFNTGNQESLGIVNNRKFVKQGLVFIQVFTPSGHATNDNDDLAESSLNLFEGVRLGDLWFNNGRITTIGSDGEWYQQNVVLEFTFEAIK